MHYFLCKCFLKETIDHYRMQVLVLSLLFLQITTIATLTLKIYYRVFIANIGFGFNTISIYGLITYHEIKKLRTIVDTYSDLKQISIFERLFSL